MNDSNHQTPVFTKRESPGNPGATQYEAAGLHWLTETGMPVVKILKVEDTTIQMEYLCQSTPSPQKAKQFGINLAHMHAAGAPTYGCAPKNYGGPAWMGRAPLKMVPPNSFQHGGNRSWGKFYAHLRIKPYVSNVFTGTETQRIVALCDLLESGELDHPEPSLVQESGCAVARIHGDLWSGNIVWTEKGGVLVDPAAQGGHAEEDLAAMSVFGTPHLDSILDGYLSVSELALGWENRVGLHQLHILIVHCYLFGRAYVPQFFSRVNTILEDHYAHH